MDHKYLPTKPQGIDILNIQSKTEEGVTRDAMRIRNTISLVSNVKGQHMLEKYQE
jgi:hypothetical protein